MEGEYLNTIKLVAMAENTNNENIEIELSLDLSADNENLCNTRNDVVQHENVNDNNEKNNSKIENDNNNCCDDLDKKNENLDTTKQNLENINLEKDNKEEDNNNKEKDNSNKNVENNSNEIIKEQKIINKSENVKENENENISKNSKNNTISNNENNNFNEEDYIKYVTYNELGEAIYTDPNTNYKYKWSENENNWEIIQCSVNEAAGTTTTTTNPYENEHYRWCTETNQWIPKHKITQVSVEGNTNEQTEQSLNTTKTTTTTTDDSSDSTIETEFYKWDKKTNQWIPKMQEASNVVYRFEDGVHTYTDHDGTVLFWDTEKNAWFPKIDDEFMARYQMNYGFIDNTTISSLKQENYTSEMHKTASSNNFDSCAETKIETVQGTANRIESNNESDGNTDKKSLKRKIPAEPPKWFDIPPEQNTKVYVSNLPDDITEDEFVQVMSKCGLIMRDPQTHKYKIKLYSESNGQLKGDGLCDYIKVESVDLALNLLDGYDVRGYKIKVQRAKFEMRGDYNPALKPRKKKKDKEKLQKMKEKLFDWRPEKMRGERSKHERIVIIKNLFEPELFDKEVHLIIEYQNDLREECSKCGTVRKVTIHDRHPDGIAQITMSSPEEADLVVQMMNRRFFGQRRLLAEIWDGKTKYKITESQPEEQNRLSNWEKFLEEDENNSKINEVKEEKILNSECKKLDSEN